MPAEGRWTGLSGAVVFNLPLMRPRMALERVIPSALRLLDLLQTDIDLGEALAIELAIDHTRGDATGNEYYMGNFIGS